MSKKLYIAVLVVTFLLVFLFGVPALFLLNSYQLPRSMGIDDDVTNLLVGVFIFLAFAPFLLANVILTYVVIYKMWASIRDGNLARTTPGKAVGFLFIPFYNIYWLFQVWTGFPTDYNKYVEHHRLNVPALASGIYTVHPVLVALSVIPGLNVLTAPISLITFVVITAKTSDAVNRLADAAQQSATPGSYN
jgi:hypothetical protein